MVDQYLPGRFKGKDVTVVDVFEAVGKHSTGSMSSKDLRKLELSSLSKCWSLWWTIYS